MRGMGVVWTVSDWGTLASLCAVVRRVCGAGPSGQCGSTVGRHEDSERPEEEGGMLQAN